MDNAAPGLGGRYGAVLNAAFGLILLTLLIANLPLGVDAASAPRLLNLLLVLLLIAVAGIRLLLSRPLFQVQGAASEPLKPILDALPALVAYVDRRRRTRFLNRAYADWFGRPTEELAGKPVRALLGERDYAVVEPFMTRALAGEPQRFERTLRLPDRRPRHVVASYIPHRNALGAVEGLFVLINDVTELKDAQAELQRHRDSLEVKVAARTADLRKEIAERKRAEDLLELDRQVLEMIATGNRLADILATLCEGVERLSRDTRCAAQLMDLDERTVVRLVAPSLPESFAAALPSLLAESPAPSAKTLSVSTDITRDPACAGIREAALAAGLRARAHKPVLSAAGKLFGALTLYYPYPLVPPPADLALLERAARLAAIACERQQAEERLNYLATHDALTGLPNRTLFHETLNRALGRAQRAGSQAAVMFIDLDRFKQVNDGLGHEAGDVLLKKVAQRLSACVRASDTVARLAGDEFVVLLEGLVDEGDARAVAAKILEVLGHPVAIGSQEIVPSASIGISLYPHDGRDSQMLLRNADLAMYRAKHEGRNNCQRFQPEMNLALEDSLAIESDLHRGLERGEFLLHYQPQLDLESGRIASLEALLRWQHPRLGLLQPGRFIPLAEETGFIIRLGDWVLRQACAQNRTWQDMGLPPVRVAVNVSSIQLRQPRFAEQVVALLEQHRLEPHYLELELTERVIMRNDRVTVDNLARLKARGVFVSIDDFGTGYGSLAYLKQFPIDALKIDQSFVQDMLTDTTSAKIVGGIIAMGKNLNLKVVAEGVEDRRQQMALTGEGCDHLQGFAISRPLEAEALPALLRMQG